VLSFKAVRFTEDWGWPALIGFDHVRFATAPAGAFRGGLFQSAWGWPADLRP